MANWNPSNQFATKRQLISSISGLYTDLQDLSGFEFQNLQVSTLTVSQWISAPIMYVSSIEGANIDLSGVLFADTLSTSIANFQFTAVSSIQFVVNPSFSVSFNAKDAIFGALSGLGFMIFETLLGAGAGTGLALKGLGEGIAAMIMARGTSNYINNTHFELLNATTQLQVSTLGNDYPLYSTITRLVSSVSGNQVPGSEIFVSSFFTPGTTCIRSISDPFPIPSSNADIATSTIQMFGEWVPLPFDDNTTSLTLSNTTDQPLFTLDRTTLSVNNLPMVNALQIHNFSNDYTFPVNTTPFPYTNDVSKILYHRDEYFLESSYVSTPYIQFQSTLTITAPDPYFITSNITEPCEFTWNGTIGFPGGDFAICDPPDTNFRSTATMDFIANTTDLLIQWGLAINNHNSTIAAGTRKRVSWDIPTNTSNFIDIPEAISTIVQENTQQILDVQTNPHELKFLTLGTGMAPSVVAWDVNGMTFGSNTALSNYQNYPYQFNSSVYIDGTLEVQNLIALSTIFAVSTVIESQLSTQSVIADFIETPELEANLAYISSVRANIPNWEFGYTAFQSRVLLEGLGTPLGIMTGTAANIRDTTHRFDIVTDTFPQALYLESRPNNNTLMYIFSTNIEIPNLTVTNLTADSIVYTNADVPNLTTSTINFGWTGSFGGSPPDFALQQNLVSPPGFFWNDYIAASNQVINLMNFSNTVNMTAQQFSTPLTYINNSFGSSNIQGWASTIFYNAQATPCRVNLVSGAGNGELSLQGQTFGIIVSLNTPNVSGLPVNVPVGSTYKFTCDGTTWSTDSNAPTPGTVSYTNNLKMTIDYETVNISTTDTLNLSAEKINLNGVVNIPNATFSNLYLDGFLSTNIVNGNTFTAASFPTSVTNSGTQPFEMFNTTSTASDGLINIRNTLIPSRGFNLFNSYNRAEWNNTQFNIDTTTAAGRPTMIVGEVIVTSPPFPAYSGQFWVNNTVDSPALTIPIYQNIEGVLSTIGTVAGNTYARVFTANGTNWSIQTNVPQPQGTINTTYPNYYTVGMTSAFTTINAGMPLIYNTPSINYNTNKVFFYSPQIRVATIDAPSFNTREAGMENVFYYDSNVIFSFQSGNDWESAAFNPVLGIYGNTYYSLAGWICFACMTRFRGDGGTLVLAWDIDATAFPVGGGATDFVWGSARYIQVRHATQPDGNIRENYLMIPRNYFNFAWQGQGPLN